MHTKRRWTWLLAIVAVTTLLAAACGDDDGGSGGGATGTVTVSGSSTVEPISSAAAEVFIEENGDVDISVEGPGTGDGFKMFCAGETDISDASRPIKEEEAAECDKAGIEFIELKIAFDGISVLTAPDNAGRVPQLRRPLRADRPRVRGLRELDRRARSSPPSSGSDTAVPRREPRPHRPR